jgi:outer membrane protein assembly factor BamB
MSVGQAAEWGLKEGDPAIKSATALAFGPDGIVFVGDAKGAAIFAIDTGDTKGDAAKAEQNVANLNGEVAKTLGTSADKITINDLAVNPLTGNVFVAVTKGQGADAAAALVKVDASGKLSEISLKKVAFQKAELADAPEDKEVNRNGRTSNPRNDAITDLAYAEGKVYVSGLAAGQVSKSIMRLTVAAKTPLRFVRSCP